MRNRQAQWMSEQGRYGKPVGECTDHGCFGKSADIADPMGIHTLLEDGCDNKDNGHQQEQAGGKSLICIQLFSFCFIIHKVGYMGVVDDFIFSI